MSITSKIKDSHTYQVNYDQVDWGAKKASKIPDCKDGYEHEWARHVVTDTHECMHCRVTATSEERYNDRQRNR